MAAILKILNCNIFKSKNPIFMKFASKCAVFQILLDKIQLIFCVLFPLIVIVVDLILCQKMGPKECRGLILASRSTTEGSHDQHQNATKLSILL